MPIHKIVKKSRVVILKKGSKVIPAKDVNKSFLANFKRYPVFHIPKLKSK